MTPCFEFIQVALGRKNTLSSVPSNGEWQHLFLFCKRQALVGIGFTAVEKLHKAGMECPKGLMMQWMALAMQIEKRNKRMNVACEKVSAMFHQDGFDCCVLKGQGNLLNYTEELSFRRQPGDIDIWVVPQNKRNAIKEVLSYVLQRSKPVEGARYCHIDMPIIHDIEIEVHYRTGHLNSPLRNRRMQRWFDAHADECMKNKTQMGFSVPTASVNVIYQLTHIFTHFFDEGVGLRQLMDYYFVLERWHHDCMEKSDLQSQGMWMEGLGTPILSKEEVMRTLKSFGMAKFAAAVMWVLHEVFDMPAPYYICEPDEKRGKELLDEIMLAGNFGQYDERGKEMKHGGMIKHGMWKLKRIMRLVGNYPEEALCEPFFRIWHWGWRMIHKKYENGI